MYAVADIRRQKAYGKYAEVEEDQVRSLIQVGGHNHFVAMNRVEHERLGQVERHDASQSSIDNAGQVPDRSVLTEQTMPVVCIAASLDPFGF